MDEHLSNKKRFHAFLAILPLSFTAGCLLEFNGIAYVGVNIETSQIQGDLLLDDGQFPASQYDHGDILLSHAETDINTTVANTYAQDYNVLLINGEFSWLYSLREGGTDVPLNSAAVILDDRSISANETINLSLTTVTITPEFTLNGASFPRSQYDHAAFYLQPVGSDELILLGESHIDNQSVKVVPGNYHVIYDVQQRGAESPINKNARLLNNIELLNDQRLIVDVQAGDFRPSFTHNGGSFPASVYDHADFYLQDTVTGAESFLFHSYDSAISLPVIDATYNLLYKCQQCYSIPGNTGKIIASNVELSGGGAFVGDLTSITIDANVTLNGAPFPVSIYEHGSIELYNTESSTYTDIGNTYDTFSDIVIFPGTYSIAFSHKDGKLIPRNTRGIFIEDMSINNSGAIDIDVPAIDITPQLTLNSASFPQSIYETAQLYLSGDLSTEDILLGNTHQQDEPIKILPGSYDLYYRHTDGELIPRNNNFKLLSQHALSQTDELALDVESRDVVLVALLNDEEFPKSVYETADLFMGSNRNDDVLMLKTHLAGTPVKLIPGDYLISYSYQDGDSIPVNHWMVVSSVTLPAPEDEPIDQILANE